MTPDRPPAWVARWVGSPWVEVGRGPEGYDCWGLVCAVARARWGVVLPTHSAAYAAGADAHDLADVVAGRHGLWDPIEEEIVEPGDVVLLRLRGAPCHVGLIVARGWMLHVVRGSNAVVEDLRRMTWQHRVVGYFRHPEIHDVETHEQWLS